MDTSTFEEDTVQDLIDEFVDIISKGDATWITNT